MRFQPVEPIGTSGTARCRDRINLEKRHILSYALFYFAWRVNFLSVSRRFADSISSRSLRIRANETTSSGDKTQQKLHENLIKINNNDNVP